jgi:hypothetical protein
MDFYKNTRNVNNFRIILLIAFLSLFFIHLYNLVFNNTTDYWGLLANLLWVFLMIYQIRNFNKTKKND